MVTYAVLCGSFWNPFSIRYISDLSALKALLAFWSEWQVVGVMIYGANDDQITADPSIGVRKA